MFTIQRKLFCSEYVIDFNATNAAIRAGYSKKTAYSQGGRLLKSVEVQHEISRLVNEKLGTNKSQLKYKVIKELKAIAFADVTDDINVITKSYEEPILDDNGKPTGEVKVKEYQIVEIKDTKQSEQSVAIASIKQDAKGAIEIKYHDKTKALDMLGKYGGLWIEKIEITGKDGGPILTKAQKTKRLKELLKKRSKNASD